MPPVWRYGEGYKAGAKAIDPNIKVQVVYHSDVDISKTFNDPAWGKTTALSMINKGADMVFGAGGNTGNGALFRPRRAEGEGQSLAIGVDTDQYFTVPEAQAVLCRSAMKLLTPGVFDLIKAVQDGTFKGGNNYGTVGLAPYHDVDCARCPPTSRRRWTSSRRTWPPARSRPACAGQAVSGQPLPRPLPAQGKGGNSLPGGGRGCFAAALFSAGKGAPRGEAYA